MLVDFNPRAPCGARPFAAVPAVPDRSISTHAPLAGRDCIRSGRPLMAALFQPTRPLRGATGLRAACVGGRLISTHAPLAGRDHAALATDHKLGISTHAPLAGRDAGVVPHFAQDLISTHAPLAGRDADFLHPADRQVISTHAPLAGRDTARRTRWASPSDFNPRAPCGARRGARHRHRCRVGISTHAPLAGRDGRSIAATFTGRLFQPTRPLRGATP